MGKFIADADGTAVKTVKFLRNFFPVLSSATEEWHLYGWAEGRKRGLADGRGRKSHTFQEVQP
jgi:hypothetical protein